MNETGPQQEAEEPGDVIPRASLEYIERDVRTNGLGSGESILYRSWISLATLCLR